MKKRIFPAIFSFALSGILILPVSAHTNLSILIPASERGLSNTSSQTRDYSAPYATPGANASGASLFSTPKKTMGGSYSSNRLKGKSRKKFTPRYTNRVRLRASFPAKLRTANYNINWRVTNLHGRNAIRGKGKITGIGKSAIMHLSPGRYRVTLRIGSYTKSDVINVRKSRNTLQSFSIPVDAGLLKVTANNTSKTLRSAKVIVKDSNGRIVAHSNGRSIKRLLPAGKYTVQTSYQNKVKDKKTVHVRKGAIKTASVSFPRSSKVRLRAFEKNNQPLMKSSSWVVYDSSGKVISKTRTHTHRLALLPGTYTAQLTVNGKKVKKRFKVASGKNRTISLYM